MAYATKLGSDKKSFICPVTLACLLACLLAYMSHPNLIVRIFLPLGLVYHKIVLFVEFNGASVEKAKRHWLYANQCLF